MNFDTFAARHLLKISACVFVCVCVCVHVTDKFAVSRRAGASFEVN
jgi:hypothetical protein